MATTAAYGHAEAFCLMRYEAKDKQESEVIWNSRDGVTPFGVTSRNGGTLYHVDWQRDTRAIMHTPRVGDRIFLDATEELLADKLRAYIDKLWGAADYPMSQAFDTKEAAYKALAKSWWGAEHGSHEPTIAFVVSDGGHKYTLPNGAVIEVRL